MTENSSINHTVTLKKEDFGYICRCCLSRNTIANIFQLTFHETFLVDIFKLFNTQVLLNDDLPKNICASCTAAIINFYNFKKMYDKSVATLENIARQSKETVKKKGILFNLLTSTKKLNNLPSLGKDVENANTEVQNHKVSPLKEDKENENIELQNNVTTLQIISQDSNEVVENNKKLLSRTYENHEILPLGDVENVDIKVEENQIIKEELDKESQNESNDQETINDSDNNATTILKETQKSDQTIISTRKDKYLCDTCGKSYLQKEALEIHYRNHNLMFLANIDNAEKGESDSITNNTTKQKKKFYYQCSCEETFKSPQDLMQHKKEKNHQDPLYKDCKICNRGFKKHMKSMHSGTSRIKSYPCKYCGSTIRGNSNLKKHIMIHTGEKPHVCEFCGKGFIQKIKLEYHRRMHTGEKPFLCDFCGKSFTQEKLMRDHRRLHTGEKPYLCEQCGLAFRSYLLYNKHLRRKHRDKTAGKMELQCEICNKSYTSKKFFEQHMNGHEEKKYNCTNMEVQCEICNESFSSKKSFKLHMNQHEEKKYKCTHCKKGFHTKKKLDSHLITHGSEKKFLCTSCGKAFKSMLGLKLHESIHTGKRPHTCKICFKTFRQNQHLVSHMKIHTGEKPYGCPYCDRSFAHSTSRVAHVRSHTGERPYVCDVCCKRFSTSSSMTKHRKRHFKNNIENKLLEFI